MKVTTNKVEKNELINFNKKVPGHVLFQDSNRVKRVVEENQEY
jgi:hypothetical protein